MMEKTYALYRRKLFGLAYRMTGSAADAEDAVQEVFTRFMQTDLSKVNNEQAYLVKMTVNHCINLLQSSRRRLEEYIGPWLPEPLPGEEWEMPVDPVERREQIGYAYIVMLQQLTPLERAVYIMKETLGMEYRDIAETLAKTELRCRKIFSRAGKKMQEQRGIPFSLEAAEGAMQERFVEAFLRASDTGDFKPLLAFLTNEVTLVSDGGGKVRAAYKPIFGIKRVLAFFEGLAAKGRFQDGFVPVRVNGGHGAALQRNGRTTMVICPEWEPEGSRVRKLYMIVNPVKLHRFG